MLRDTIACLEGTMFQAQSIFQTSYTFHLYSSINRERETETDLMGLTETGISLFGA